MLALIEAADDELESGETSFDEASAPIFCRLFPTLLYITLVSLRMGSYIIKIADYTKAFLRLFENWTIESMTAVHL